MRSLVCAVTVLLLTSRARCSSRLKSYFSYSLIRSSYPLTACRSRGIYFAVVGGISKCFAWLQSRSSQINFQRLAFTQNFSIKSSNDKGLLQQRDQHQQMDYIKEEHISHSLAHPVLLACVTCFALAAIAVGLRLLSRWLAKTSLGKDDYIGSCRFGEAQFRLQATLKLTAQCRNRCLLSAAVIANLICRSLPIIPGRRCRCRSPRCYMHNRWALTYSACIHRPTLRRWQASTRDWPSRRGRQGMYEMRRNGKISLMYGTT